MVGCVLSQHDSSSCEGLPLGKRELRRARQVFSLRAVGDCFHALPCHSFVVLFVRSLGRGVAVATAMVVRQVFGGRHGGVIAKRLKLLKVYLDRLVTCR